MKNNHLNFNLIFITYQHLLLIRFKRRNNFHADSRPDFSKNLYFMNFRLKMRVEFFIKNVALFVKKSCQQMRNLY